MEDIAVNTVQELLLAFGQALARALHLLALVEHFCILWCQWLPRFRRDSCLTAIAIKQMDMVVFPWTPARMLDTSKWAEAISPEPGVYALWDLETKVPAYVGQTSSLRKRMSDIGRSVNHTCRRKVAAILGVGTTDDAALSLAMSRRYVLSYIEVLLGRAELEEYLVLRWSDYLINRPSKRLLKGTRYSWVVRGQPALTLELQSI